MNILTIVASYLNAHTGSWAELAKETGVRVSDLHALSALSAELVTVADLMRVAAHFDIVLYAERDDNPFGRTEEEIDELLDRLKMAEGS